MAHVFRTNKGNYLIADDFAPLHFLPFDKENLHYVGQLTGDVTAYAQPENSSTVGTGIGRYDVYYAHIGRKKLDDAVKRNLEESERVARKLPKTKQ